MTNCCLSNTLRVKVRWWADAPNIVKRIRTGDLKVLAEVMKPEENWPDFSRFAFSVTLLSSIGNFSFRFHSKLFFDQKKGKKWLKVECWIGKERVCVCEWVCVCACVRVCVCVRERERESKISRNKNKKRNLIKLDERGPIHLIYLKSNLR